MGTWGEEFINASAGRTAARGLTAWIREKAVDPFNTPSPPPGLTLYFPPGIWVLSEIGSTPLVLPDLVDVMIAPGARVIPVGPGAILEIRGQLRAPIGQVFTTDAARPVGLDPAIPVGEVRLTGERMERVHPEWWGAKTGGGSYHDAHVNSAAIDAAIRAAWGRVAHGVATYRRPLVVELLGSYTISRSIRVGTVHPGRPGADGALIPPNPPLPWPSNEPGDRGQLELRGRETEGESTFVCDPAFDGLAVLHLGLEVDAARIEAVSFDGNGAASTCVAIDVTQEQDVTRLPYELRRCAFKRGLESLLEARYFPDLLDFRTDWSDGVSVPQLQVEHCLFAPALGVRSKTGWASNGTLNTPREVVPVAVWMIGATQTSIALRGCTFVGEASTMIRTQGSDVVLTSCRFANTLVPPKVRSATRAESLLDLHATGPEGGLDVFLEPALDLTGADARGQIVRTEQQKRESTQPYPKGGYPQDTPLDRVLPALTAQDCRSTSVQFLATPIVSNATSGRDTTLIGLHHDPLGFGLAFNPPAVHWRPSGTSGPNLSVTLIGCRLDGASRPGLPRVQAVHTSGRPAVFEYGLCDGTRPAIDPRTTPGVIAPTLIGDAPPRGAR
jgi:hypothetical protein